MERSTPDSKNAVPAKIGEAQMSIEQEDIDAESNISGSSEAGDNQHSKEEEFQQMPAVVVDEEEKQKTGASCVEGDLCMDQSTCGCPQLEAEAVLDNRQLLAFQVRSRDIDWRRYVQPLDTRVRSGGVYLDKQADLVNNHRRAVNEQNKRELLVCHDMMGNYLEDRHFHSSEKYDDYRFMHWSAVDYFCYFSHKYVTIPPSGWLNAAHRHGVPVLGTYIVESAGPLNEVLASEESVNRAVAALTRLCLHFGFEGWLVNVEVTVPRQSMPNLHRFVRELRAATESQVPHGRVFWYDSVIESGELRWQNELNARNVDFFRISDAMLINYAWDDGHLERSASVATQEGSPQHRVFMGLDVFGRSRRGGFKSLDTMTRIAEKGFSAGIFAPAWSFETLRNWYDISKATGDEVVNAAFLSRNEDWWARLWPLLATHPYQALPFYTDFCVGSGQRSFVRGSRDASPTGRSFFNLARQSLQPSVPMANNAKHCFHTAFAGGNSLEVINYERAFRLFVTDFVVPRGVLLLGYAYRMEDAGSDQTFSAVVRLSPFQPHSQDLRLFCGSYHGNIVAPHLCYISPLEEPMPAGLAPAQLPQSSGLLGDGWRVRYYMVRFDGPVVVKDIGLNCRRALTATAEAYLGAIYVQALFQEDWMATQCSQKASIDVYGRQLWQNHS
ncbi:cytosolic endo-beta-N-acetylglucosaminidase isoform X1 [Drosophila guanche]|uniref:Blast:Cytosolic endo-beta-N-acetylglucosaminidase n=1 Tax=Drosophila guanche TaxID=7266 RepID=A0A3B0JBV6_DROGU|nr:cytosolic endo-beta-N-acetylglucosaminidase isoform X1 [Drosophila guanche]XP_034123778.1 cytosolic endo-beta-N-acetylglucosaminidase isoform X1 [Drosophila guanche]XP_034123779.1 cytosolic endo-beta-N-acetylglucosaminidase isoform X1 [Drosophila guanche]SPP77983.1 blast:Cytosolic endo-beta-N-acetylglucosaminidase [Drosophila guanche]